MPRSLLDLTADELMARGIAPIKKEYRLEAIRYTYKQPEAAAAATAGTAADATAAGDTPGAATADDALEAAAPTAAAAAAAAGGAPAVAADGQAGHKRIKSKKQKKKDRQDADAAAGGRLCTAFMLSTCRYGDSCKFSHDMAAYLAAKPADLPGVCPHSKMDKCPYGLSCRWAGTHKTANGNTNHLAAVEAAEAAQPAEAAPPAEGDVPQSVPMEPFSPVQPPINTLPKQLQQQLWKRQYNFSRATQAVAAAKKVVAGSGNSGGANGKQQQQQQQKQQLRDIAEAPVAKKQRVEPAAAAAPAAAAPAKGTAADVVMQEAAAPAAADTAAAATAAVAAADEAAVAATPAIPPFAAAAAAAAAASAAAAAADVDDLDELYGDTYPVTPHNSLVIDTPPPTPAAAAAAAALAGSVQPSDAALIAALNAEMTQQQQQQQQQQQRWDGVGGVVELSATEPRNRPQLDLRGKTYLAPLTTVGNLPFRRLCVDLGCEVTCGEMSLASNLLSGQLSEWALLKKHPSEKCFGVQVCGGYPDQMAQIAQLLDEQLGDNIDFVDINCGCPIDVICSKGAGSSLLLKPRRLEEVVRSVTSCINKPVIVKIRKGYFDNSDIAHELIPQMPAWGAAAVTLHGRTRQQRYSRAADWSYIRKCAGIASSVGLPLIGNGDVFSPSEWNQRLSTAEGDDGGCGVTTAMIGRAALIKPWVFTEIREQRLWDISASERLDLVKGFVSHGLEAWGSDDRGVQTTRRFLLEWLSFTHRYIPVGLLEVVPQVMSWRPPAYCTRSKLEGLLSSESAADWVKISEMFLGPAPAGFTFVPKHKSNAYTLTADALARMVETAAGTGGNAGAAEDGDEGEENG